MVLPKFEVLEPVYWGVFFIVGSKALYVFSGVVSEFVLRYLENLSLYEGLYIFVVGTVGVDVTYEVLGIVVWKL